MTSNQLASLIESTLEKKSDLLPLQEAALMRKRLHLLLMNRAQASGSVESIERPIYEIPVEEHRRVSGTIEKILKSAKSRAMESGRDSILMEDVIRTMDEIDGESLWPFQQ